MSGWTPTPGTVRALVCAAASMSGSRPSEIAGPCRVQELCTMRWAVMLVAHRRGAGSSQIGRCLGRDHSTVIAGIRRGQQLETEQTSFRLLVRALERAVPEPAEKAEAA